MAGIDFPDFEGLQSLAALISSGGVSGAPGGVPLLTFENVVIKTTVTIPALSSFTSSVVNIPQIAYNLSISLAENVAGNKPQAGVRMSWIDQASGSQDANDVYQMWIGAPGNAHTVYGYGPSKANQLQVIVTNQDNQAVTMTLQVVTESRVFLSDIWRTVGTLPPITGKTIPSSNTDAYMLAHDVETIGAANAVDVILPMWIGHAYCFFSTDSATTDADFFIQFIDNNAVGSTFNLVEFNSNSKGVASGEVWLPRGMCSLHLRNNAAAAHNLAANIIAVDH